METPKITPFLRWAGGKSKLISQIEQFVPDDIQKRKYLEPFLGAGSLFFRTQPTYGIISDLNSQLINCYSKIKERPDAVYDSLQKLTKNNGEDFYYLTREKFNRSNNTYIQAARFIYLNKTCYNGLYRVNLKGNFNVPFGKINTPSILNYDSLKSISHLLKDIEIVSCSYQSVLNNSKKGNFIYLDPPYPPLNKTAFFNSYTKDLFGINEQIELANYANQMSKRGCLILISNADTQEVRKLYKGWKIEKLNITRWISCKTDRKKVDELIIRNF